MLNQVVRFVPVLRLLDELGGGTLLDVGSGSRGLAPWLDGWEVTAADVSFDDYGGSRGPSGPARAVVADARDLPFPDRSFDAVVSLDMLEHVSPADRMRVLAELARTAARRAIVACPAGFPAWEADRALAGWYAREARRSLPGWLEEHLEAPFPDAQELAAGLKGHGPLRLLGNEHVRAHAALMRAEGTRVGLGASLALERVLRPALRRRGGRRASDALLRILRGGDRQPTYRTIAVLDIAA